MLSSLHTLRTFRHHSQSKTCKRYLPTLEDVARRAGTSVATAVKPGTVEADLLMELVFQRLRAPTCSGVWMLREILACSAFKTEFGHRAFGRSREISPGIRE